MSIAAFVGTFLAVFGLTVVAVLAVIVLAGMHDRPDRRGRRDAQREIRYRRGYDAYLAAYREEMDKAYPPIDTESRELHIEPAGDVLDASPHVWVVAGGGEEP